MALLTVQDVKTGRALRLQFESMWVHCVGCSPRKLPVGKSDLLFLDYGTGQPRELEWVRCKEIKEEGGLLRIATIFLATIGFANVMQLLFTYVRA